MKGILYCFKVLGIRDSNDSNFLKNKDTLHIQEPKVLTNIYKIDTTILNIHEVIKNLEAKKPSKNRVSKRKLIYDTQLTYELMFCVEIDEINKLDIFENLYLYKYMKHIPEDNLYKVDLSKIKNLVMKDLKNLELRKRKLLHINSFLENVLLQESRKISWNIEFLNHFKSKKNKEDIQTMRFIDLYDIYLKWFKIGKCSTNLIEKEISQDSETECSVLVYRNSKERAEICEFLELCETYTVLGKSNEYYEWEF